MVRIPCHFKTLSLGPKGIGIGINFERGAIGLNDVDATFVDALITGSIHADPNSRGDPDGQVTMAFDDMIAVEISGEVGGFSVRSDHVAVSVKIPLTVDIKKLSKFPGCAGLIIVNQTSGRE